jgi:hypothetical protein
MSSMPSQPKDASPWVKKLMNANWSGRLTLIAIVASTVIGFFFWLFGLFSLWLFLQSVGISADFWAMTEALSTAVTAAAVLGAGFVAYRELAEVASSRYMEVADRLFNELNSPENIEARRWIFQDLPDEPQEGMHSLTPEGQAFVKRTLNSLDRVAFLTQAGWIPEEMVMPWMNPMIVKAWIKLEPYVDYESRRRNEPDYYEHARRLAERCLSWRAKNLHDAKITWVDDAL